METVRKYGGNLGQGRNRGDIMAEKIQRSHCSCIWELCFLLISHAYRHVRSVRRRRDGSFMRRRRNYIESRHKNESCEKK